MPRKKKSKEEIQREIDAKVQERLEQSWEEDFYNAKKEFIENAFNGLKYGFYYSSLTLKYVLETARWLINESGLSDDDKELLRYAIAEDMVYGTRGIKEEDRDAAKANIEAIMSYLRRDKPSP